MNRIMVVDDASFMRMMIKDILAKTEFEVVAEAANGQEAIDRVEEADADLIILDITMPVMDGLTAAEQIMRLVPRVRIVFCSAMGHREVVLKALAAGAADFIVKPFTADRLVEAVRKAMASKAPDKKGASA